MTSSWIYKYPPPVSEQKAPSLHEAAQQALEALLTYEQYIQPLTNYFGGPRVPEEGSASAKVDAAITALRAALAEPTWCEIHQHHKWCEHNGGKMGPTGWEAP